MEPSSNTDFRKNNGLIILQQGNIIANGENNYTVKSQTFAGKQYTVELLENVWVCSIQTLNTVKLNPVSISMLLIYSLMLIRKRTTSEDTSLCRGCY